MRWRDWLPFGDVPEFSPEEVARRRETGAPLQIIDVRTTREYRSGHIAGALHVPLQTLSAVLPTLALDSHHPIVLVCKTAHRSRPAVRLLKSVGFDARQLEGGMDRWRHLGLPVVAAGPTPDGDRP